MNPKKWLPLEVGESGQKLSTKALNFYLDLAASIPRPSSQNFFLFKTAKTTHFIMGEVETSASYHEEHGFQLFPFHDLDYIPHGTGGILAPYIETTVGTMRAAATLMLLDLVSNTEILPPPLEPTKKKIICDLGCGDGDFRTKAVQTEHLLPRDCSDAHP